MVAKVSHSAARQFGADDEHVVTLVAAAAWNDETAFLGNIAEENGAAFFAHRSGSFINHGIAGYGRGCDRAHKRRHTPATSANTTSANTTHTSPTSPTTATTVSAAQSAMPVAAVLALHRLL